MEQVFPESIITHLLLSQQYELAIQHHKNKRKYKQVKLTASKLNSAKFIGPLYNEE